MNAPSTPDSHESNAANPAIEGGTVSPVSVGEKHCVAVARAMEERKGLLTRESVQVSAVGDLDGSMSQCVALSEREWFIGSKRDWTGGSRKVVFSGDMLADVFADGFEILMFIRKLRGQARAQGGDITVLAGNHEEFMLWYLVGGGVNQWRSEIQGILRGMDIGNGDNKAKGMTELFAFWNARDEILANMRLDEKGRMLLEEMTNMKLVELIGKKIYFHTPPNRGMLSLVSGSGDVAKSVSDINRDWQRALRSLLLRDSNTQEAKAVYDTYASIFLHTANDTRESMLVRARGKVSALLRYADSISSENPQDYAVLKQNGICTVVYGHTDSLLSVEGIEFVRINKKSLSMNAPKPDEDDSAARPVGVRSSP